MSRQYSPLLRSVILGALLASGLFGCSAQQPFYFHEDGDLSHYLDVATEIEYPDLEAESLDEVNGSIRPFSLENHDTRNYWDLTLEEAVQNALANSKVMKSIGGQVLGAFSGAPEALTRSPEAVPTVYDPALIETNPRFGTEAALSAFDAQFTSSVFWEKNDAPRNPLVFLGSEDVFPRRFKQDVGSFQAQLSKTAATGGTWIMRHNVQYDKQNVSRLFTSDWNVNLEAEFRQPLLQGGGVNFNRIAGPGAIPGFNNGVMIARINTDIALADFEAGVRNLVYDVEIAYWELAFAYRSLDAVIAGRDAGLQSWRYAKVEFDVGTGDILDKAQAEAQYHLFVSVMERALNNVYATESKLRYLMGLAATDGRMIRPADEPTVAKVYFDWDEVVAESLCRSVELRRQKWQVKRRNLELIAAKNYLLPRLDATARYRWLGLGDHLINPGGTGIEFDNAYESMTTGDFGEWNLGFEASIPIGFRKEMSGVRYAELNIARERARLQEMELEVSHQLAHAIRETQAALKLANTNFNRRIAAKQEVQAAESKKEAGLQGWRMSEVLDAQRRLAEAESDFYRSVFDYNKGIAEVHYRKGSLLEYNGVHLTEGPWTGKAYFDAHRRARQRDASVYLDYGFTMPSVISRGAYQQQAGTGPVIEEGMIEGIGLPDIELEELPTPTAEPIESSDEPDTTEPEPLDLQTKAEPESGGPELRMPKNARWSVAKKAAPTRASKVAGKRASKSSAVKRASYEEPLSNKAKPKRSTSARKKVDNGAWVSSKSSTGRKHERNTTPPARPNDRTASGWQRAQRG